jgi:hypothetical protein
VSVPGTRPYELAPPLPVLEISINRTTSFPRCALFVADNVLSHEDALGAYSRARQADPTLESVTVPLDRGLEVSVVLM